MNNKISRWRLRYSLRFLLLAITAGSVFLVWIMLPTFYARRFAAAVNAGNYEQAERLCVDPERVFPGSWDEHQHFEPKARLKPLAWSDLWSGERQLLVTVTYGDGGGLASGGVECSATRGGIEVGMALP